MGSPSIGPAALINNEPLSKNVTQWWLLEVEDITIKVMSATSTIVDFMVFLALRPQIRNCSTKNWPAIGLLASPLVKKGDLLSLKIFPLPPPAPVRPAQDEPQLAHAPLEEQRRPQVGHAGRSLPRRHQEGSHLHLPGQHRQVQQCTESVERVFPRFRELPREMFRHLVKTHSSFDGLCTLYSIFLLSSSPG